MLEHVNLDVPSLDSASHFLLAAFPDFRIRGDGSDPIFGRWLHIGNDQTYVALQEAGDRTETQSCLPLRHLGWVVDDVEALMQRLNEAGYEDTIDAASLDAHPFRRRVYYTDRNGLEHEFVQYLSAVTDERNDYRG